MEEIEYLEEYEDFILPNEARSEARFSEERKSMDSLEVLYKDLIGDSPTPGAEIAIDSDYTANAVESTEDTSVVATQIDVSFVTDPYPKPNTTSAPSTYTSATSASDQLQQSIYKSPTSFLNRAPSKTFSTYSASVQRPKSKSVATVKPTLQRLNNSAKQYADNNSPPLKNSAAEQSLHSTSVVSQTASKMTYGSQGSASASKSKHHSKSSIKQTKSRKGSGMDPLSLDDHDAFLDLDVDRAGSVDALDFESDFDNSITGGISDMDSDSVDFSDDFSDNLDFESDLSSDGSVVRKIFKRKKLQQGPADKTKATATSMKLEQKGGQTNLIRSKSTQNLKVGTDQQQVAQKIAAPEKKASTSSLGKLRTYSAIRKPRSTDKRESSIALVTSKVKRVMPSQELSKLLAQELLKNSDDDLKTNKPTSNSNQTAVLAHCKRMITQLENELSRKLSKSTTKASPNTNVEKPKLVDQESLSDVSATRPVAEQKIIKPPTLQQAAEPTPQKEAVITVKKLLIKPGSSYLKSIKPPACTKDFTIKTMVQKPVVQQPPPEQQKKKFEDKNLPTKTILEHIPKTPTTCKETKTIFSVGSNLLKTQLPHQTPPPKNENPTKPKEYHRLKETKESEFSEKSIVVHSFKPQKIHSDEKSFLENKTQTLNENDVKENNPMMQSTNCSVDKRLEDKTKDSCSLKENILNIQSRQTKVDSGKPPPLQTKFTTRCFKIRLNKNTVPQFIKSTKSSTKSKSLFVLKVLENDSEPPAKRRMLSLPNCEASAASTNESLPSSERQNMTNQTETLRQPMETQFELSSSPNTMNRQRKRKKMNLKSGRRAKVQRSSDRPLLSTGEPPQADNQYQGTTVSKPCVETKDRNDPPVLETSHVTSSEPVVQKSKAKTEPVKVKRPVGRPPKKLKNIALANRFAKGNKSRNVPGPVPPADSSDKRVQESTEPALRAASPELITECSTSKDAVPVSVSAAGETADPSIEAIEPKTELYGDTLIYHYSADGANPSESLSSGENKSNGQNPTKCPTYELPSYIVMKTKIISRDELQNNTSLVPTVVRQKIDQLNQERQLVVPVLKTERPEFKDVCQEINNLLDKNANYLKFASGSERQNRMNQVLADSSLTVEDAQCTLKFLQSYLSFRGKETPTPRTKNQQFIPIYDSQKKIIGYRKKTTNSKSSLPTNEYKQNLANRLSILSSSTSSRSTNGTLNVSKTSSTEKTIEEFTTKKEPLSLDTGDEEIIVPDAAPASSPCIKREEETPETIEV